MPFWLVVDFAIPLNMTFVLDKSVNLNATSASIWSPSCGELVKNFDEFTMKWKQFLKKVEVGAYSPRHVMAKTVGPEACTARLMQLYNLHRNNWCEQYRAKQAQQPVKNYFNMSITVCEMDCLDGNQLFR